ncbi:MAG: homoserine kinase [Actinomycetia bacterium]|nr:homoserine kinase [Actinomycetes bacterium]
MTLRDYRSDAVRVCVPASSANLGPGFDAMALALDLLDEYEVEITATPGVCVAASGESATEVPTDETHLVARAFITALAAFDAELGDRGAQLTCINRIPHGRGLGSSAAAIVGGVRLAAELVGDVAPERVLDVATGLEGHPDNAAAALLGGFVVAWTADHTQALSLKVHPDLRAVLFVPQDRSPTAAARRALPELIPHAAAAFNAARSALLLHAITQEPELLWTATQDQLHQEQRRATYPASMALVDQLRSRGWPAVISGAGPTVLVLTPAAGLAALRSEATTGFQLRELAIMLPSVDR